jgi:dephospho-CoA kinase
MIIGITGTYGAGKGEVVRYLVEKEGFFHFSARALLTEEVGRRGLVLDRQSLIDVGNLLRAEYGADYVAEELCRRAVGTKGNKVIESLRTVGEVKRLQEEEEFYLWAVDANLEERYRRIVDRGTETDKVSFEEFGRSEVGEMNSNDPSRINLAACMALADFKIDNSGTRDDLYFIVGRELRRLGEKVY